MDTITITNPTDQSFPFSRQLFEDPHVVYHGTWSVYTNRIESEGFGGVALPFDHNEIEVVMHAWEQVGILGSYAKDVFFGNKPGQPRPELSMTANFWHARAYATDGGGEVVRIMLQEAKDFESLCSNDEKRLALKARWEGGLRQTPGDRPTMRAVEVLSDKQTLNAICAGVTTARRAIEEVVKDGFPVVYALRVEPQWFGKTWERYMVNWEEGHRAAVELRCLRDFISPDRIIAKAVYPNGSDSDFLCEWCETWADVEALVQK